MLLKLKCERCAEIFTKCKCSYEPSFADNFNVFTHSFLDIQGIHKADTPQVS